MHPGDQKVIYNSLERNGYLYRINSGPVVKAAVENTDPVTGGEELLDLIKTANEELADDPNTVSIDDI